MQRCTPGTECSAAAYVMFGLRSWLAGIPAFFKGYRIGRKGKADGWTLPTAIRLHHGETIWEHRGTHAGDQPDYAAAAAANTSMQAT